MRIIYIICLLLCKPSYGLCEFETEVCLSAEETAILESFFNTMVRQSEGGYVLYEKKPMCTHGYRIKNSFFGEYDSHRDSVSLREGAAVWKKFFQGKESQVIIHIYDQPDFLCNEWVHVLFINKRLFCQKVQENLALFQYVLGPNITPITLLESFLAPGSSLNDVLKGDKVLTGILLGYGTQNSLYVSRIEELQEAYYSASEQVPFKNRYHGLKNFLGQYNDMFLQSNHITQKANLTPSFSYLTLHI